MTEKILYRKFKNNLIILRISNIIGDKSKFSKNSHKTFRPFEEARTYVRSLGLKSLQAQVGLS